MPAMERAYRKYQNDQGLRRLAFKSKSIQQFEFSEILEDLYMENVAGEQGLSLHQRPTTYHINLLVLLKMQTVINSQSLMMGVSNLAILVISMRSFHFWHLPS